MTIYIYAATFRTMEEDEAQDIRPLTNKTAPLRGYLSQLCIDDFNLLV